MSLWERITNWFRTESADAGEWAEDLRRDLSSELDRKEADLRATPTEKLRNLQEQISGHTDAFDDLKDRIAAAGGEADSEGEPTADENG